MSDLIEQLLKADSLPNPPHVILEILEFSKNPDADIQLAADIISTDPALAVKILKLVNSSSFSRGHEITTLRTALTNLGTRRTLIVALGFSMKENFPGWQDADGKPDPLLWQHSVATAVFARGLARLIGFEKSEQLFLCGLLSRIGQLLFASIATEQYREVIKAADGALPSAELERELLGSDFRVVGNLLLEKWELPKAISDVVGSWGDPKPIAQCEGDADQMATLVYLSDIAADLLLGKDKATAMQQLNEDSTELIGVAPTTIERLLVSSQTAIEEALESFNSPLDEALDCAAILDLARQQLVTLSLGMASDLSNAQGEAEKLHSENRRLEQVSTTDALTGIPNRHALELELDHIDQTQQHGRTLPYSVMMIDVDHFKKFNDTYGHAIGDTVLREVGTVLANTARSTDFVARYGGEEFCIILNNAHFEHVAGMSERFRKAIANHVIKTDSGDVNVTASFGVASSERFPSAASREIVGFADRALYDAKEKGRNCVAFAENEDELAASTN